MLHRFDGECTLGYISAHHSMLSTSDIQADGESTFDSDRDALNKHGLSQKEKRANEIRSPSMKGDQPHLQLIPNN